MKKISRKIDCENRLKGHLPNELNDLLRALRHLRNTGHGWTYGDGTLRRWDGYAPRPFESTLSAQQLISHITRLSPRRKSLPEISLPSSANLSHPDSLATKGTEIFLKLFIPHMLSRRGYAVQHILQKLTRSPGSSKHRTKEG